LFDNSCATGIGARRYTRDIEEDLEDTESSTTLVSKRRIRAIQDTKEEEGSRSKKPKLTVAEGIDRVVEEMRQSRKLKTEVATRTTRAIQLLSSEYNNLDASDMVKAISYLADPKHAEIFLALKDMKEHQESWLFQCINI
jgi:hypothetical protein